MNKIIATFRINTPMFLGGANQHNDAEIRVPSIKGALRFWWRALAYGRYNGDLEKIKTEEDALFGSTSKQASVLMNIQYEKLEIQPVNKVHDSLAKNPGLLYLGYGVCESVDNKKRGTKRGQLTRSCINEKQYFTLIIVSKSIIPDDLIDAIKLMGLLGGLGSKTRKGYGSITLTKLTLNNEIKFNQPSNTEEFRCYIQEILNYDKIPNKRPPYTAFSQDARIEIIEQDNDPLTLLNSIGKTMQTYRSWGNNGNVNGESSEQNFKFDHDLVYDIIKNEHASTHPKRVVFGLPHNYFLSTIIKSISISSNNKDFDRRSSPLMIHIHEFDSNRYAAIITIMPAKFLPDNVKISMNRITVGCQVDYSTLDDFLDGFKGHLNAKTNQPYFPNKIKIF